MPSELHCQMERIEAIVRQYFGRSLTEEEKKKFLKDGTFCPSKPGRTYLDIIRDNRSRRRRALPSLTKKGP